MLQDFYSVASGLLMQQRHLNVISNNLANAQTPGFKTNRLLSQTFEETLAARLETNNNAMIGTTEPTRIVSEVADLWTGGGVIETGRPFDLSITRFGFFNVQGEDGTTYLTRNGVFDLDDEGYLILRGQGRVLGTGGPLQLNTGDIKVSDTGVITNSITGANLGQLAITAPVEGTDIEEQRTGMYTAATVETITNPQIVQGGYEGSNVVLSDEMSAMIMTQRNFSTAAQALQFIDKTYSLAVNIAQL